MATNLKSQEASIWSFVEQHYPNYHSCADIAENDDLSAYLSDGKESETYNNIRNYMLDINSGWCGTDEDLNSIINQEVAAQLAISNSRIYEKAIQNFLQSQNTAEALDVQDLDTFLETHYEIAAAIERGIDSENPFLMAQYDLHGTGFKWETAKAWAEEFQLIHKGRIWDGEWLDTLEEFISEKINKL